MASQLATQSDFTETLAIHIALKSAIKNKQYSKSKEVQTAAQRLQKELQGDKSVFGKQLRMAGMMEKGASLAEIGRKLSCSRRTVFRYLNYFEDAGLSIKLANNKYYLGKEDARLLRS